MYADAPIASFLISQFFVMSCIITIAEQCCDVLPDGTSTLLIASKHNMVAQPCRGTQMAANGHSLLLLFTNDICSG